MLISKHSVHNSNGELLTVTGLRYDNSTEVERKVICCKLNKHLLLNKVHTIYKKSYIDYNLQHRTKQRCCEHTRDSLKLSARNRREHI